MMCLGECIIKYVLIIGNLLFSLGGLAIVGFGIAGLVSVNQISDIIPAEISSLSIWVIVLGVFIFVISLLACCGALYESICMLITYSICMLVLAGAKIYIAIVIFGFLDQGQSTVDQWITDAFNNLNIRPAFNAMELLFKCCGTTGANSYGGNVIPETCCANPLNGECNVSDSYDGCGELVASWFVNFGTIIGVIIISVIVIEILCAIFGLNVSNTIRNKRRKHFA